MNFSMKKIYCLMVLMAVTLGLKAQAVYEQELAKANFYYSENRFDTAVVIYEGILNAGYVSAPLLYNNGNAYFKMRNYPMAILNYEKALKLDPDNQEIKYNLDIANSLITDKIEPIPEFFMSRWWKNIGNKLSADAWATFSLIVLAILLVAIFFYFTARTKVLKKSMFFTGLILIVIFVCSTVFASQKRNYLSEHNEAIVIIPTITVKSSPSSSGTDLFVLHEGTKVDILDHSNDWDKIKIADGSTGWMPSSITIKY